MAPEAVAREKFHCPACGAEANWNPAKQKLICPFCGTESPATLQMRGAGTVIVEHPLVEALRSIPDSARGMAGGEDLRQMPELLGHLGLRRHGKVGRAL